MFSSENECLYRCNLVLFNGAEAIASGNAHLYYAYLDSANGAGALALAARMHTGFSMRQGQFPSLSMNRQRFLEKAMGFRVDLNCRHFKPLRKGGQCRRGRPRARRKAGE